jgi:hypothetical protein
MTRFNADILGRLGEATPEDLTASLAAIREDYSAIQAQGATDANVEAVRSLRDAAVAIRGEVTRRADSAKEFTETGTELTNLFAEMDGTTAASGEGDGGTGDATGAAKADDAATGDAKLADTAEGTAGAATQDTGAEGADKGSAGSAGEGEAVTASAGRPLGGGNNLNVGTTVAEPTLGRVQYRTTAAAGLDNITAGARLTAPDLRQALFEKIRSVRAVPGYERYRVATVRSEYPEDRMLTASADTNMELVRNAVADARGMHALQRSGDGQHALVAAGLCAPLENLYDIRVVGSTGRPVRDALVRFGAERGGIQYRPAMSGVTQTGGIGFWDEDDDTADPLVPKTCVEIACPGLVTAQVQAIYKCLTFSNMSTRFDPEYMQAVIDSQDIAHDRIAENTLLTQLIAGSKAVYSEQLLGATRDILATLDKMIAYYRNVHRLADEVPLRWIAPLWALYLMRADMTRQMVGDGLQVLALTDQEIVSWFRARNVNPTFHLDGIDPADLTVPEPDVPVPAQFYTLLAANSPVPDFPSALSTLLFAEGDWLWLDGGTLDVGVVRDSTLVGQNRFQMFSEGFEFAAFRGIESIHLIIPASPTGASAATVEVTPAEA